jgi:hypothetical protein
MDATAVPTRTGSRRAAPRTCVPMVWPTYLAPGCYLQHIDNTAYGAESLTQCSDHNNNWCCNADNVNVKCCQESPAPRPFFQLQDGKAYATIGKNQASNQPNLASITGLASGSGSGTSPATSAPASSAPPPASSSPSATPTATPTPFSSAITSVSSGSAGVQTIIKSVLVTPTPDPTANTASTNNNSSSGSSGSSKTGLIVGCAVGIPLALALIGIVAWMLRKRRQQKNNAYKTSSELDNESTTGTPLTGAAAAHRNNEKYRQSRPGTIEADSLPAGPGRPISQIPGHAELDSGTGFHPNHGSPYAPDTVGLGGGNGDGRSTWGTAPPGYSPGMAQTGFHAPANASELDGTSALPVINEQPQYQAYRPPPTVAELPTVKTPPEESEKRL